MKSEIRKKTPSRQIRDRTSGITGGDDETRVAQMYARAFTNPEWMETHLHEACSSRLSTSPSIRGSVKHAKRREWKEIELPLPWDDPFAVFLRQHLPAETVLESGATGGALMKIVDFPALMKRLEPMLRIRWRDGAGINASVRIVTDIGNCMIRMFHGDLQVHGIDAGSLSSSAKAADSEPDEKVVKIPSRWLSGLVTGYYSVQDIAGRKGVSIPHDIFDVRDILFPSGWPFVYQGDNY
jgi:hypothetical protein